MKWEDLNKKKISIQRNYKGAKFTKMKTITIILHWAFTILIIIKRSRLNGHPFAQQHLNFQGTRLLTEDIQRRFISSKIDTSVWMNLCIPYFFTKTWLFIIIPTQALVRLNYKESGLSILVCIGLWSQTRRAHYWNGFLRGWKMACR